VVIAVIETEAVRLHYCKENDSRKQLLDLRYLLTVILQSLWVAGKPRIKQPAISRGFLCSKAEDAKSAIT